MCIVNDSWPLFGGVSEMTYTVSSGMLNSTIPYLYVSKENFYGVYSGS